MLRTLSAPDWEDGGHANTAVWLGTNGNIEATWVEAGVTKGFGAENVYVFYSAHRYWDGSKYVYDDRTIPGKVPVLGRVTLFSVFKEGNLFRAKVSDYAGSASVWYAGHALPSDKWDIGGEYSCPQSSRIDRTYVVTNQYRRASDGVWMNATSGVLKPSGNSGTGIVWCPATGRTNFRFWSHSQISTSECW